MKEQKYTFEICFLSFSLYFRSILQAIKKLQFRYLIVIAVRIV